MENFYASMRKFFLQNMCQEDPLHTAIRRIRDHAQQFIIDNHVNNFGLKCVVKDVDTSLLPFLPLKFLSQAHILQEGQMLQRYCELPIDTTPTTQLEKKLTCKMGLHNSDSVMFGCFSLVVRGQGKLNNDLRFEFGVGMDWWSQFETI